MRRNLEAVSNHLIQVMVGNNADSEAFLGKTLKINLRIGHLIVKPMMMAGVTFEALPLTKIMADSREQGDDVKSKESRFSPYRRSTISSSVISMLTKESGFGR